MKFLKIGGKLNACFSAKEIATLLMSDFFLHLFSNEKLKNESYDSITVSEFVKSLVDKSANSTDYELYSSILDLYEQFEKNCEFCFNLKSTFNPKVNTINSINDLYSFREDPPDVIVLYKNILYEFELKRYRDEFTFEKLYAFIKKKIILHYSGKINFLVILQLKPYSKVDIYIFRKLHENLKKEKNQPGIICFSFNKNNEEMLLVQVLPEIVMSTRPYNDVETFADILHQDSGVQ